MYDDIMIAEWIEAAFTPWGSRPDGNELAEHRQGPDWTSRERLLPENDRLDRLRGTYEQLLAH
ncbi:hypothetical protein AM571_CH00297 [Rhizobium etli 8C-3]|uniref:Uncharacterized protein n=2 Tax=Rhizobium TaxID=379 RepID=A0A1L5NZ14_RHIET|nr:MULTISPECIES: hypothetical protein [Rhizobium]APO73150.1 hypothetical protein AM571_CH00297 [Rhizobium etli 8C-3]TCU38676.1 hypothetical protein EV129_104280 [Rhizobium azibense]